MDIKIVTLIENNPDDSGRLHFEHGLSMYIEADDMKILFDTGQTGAFVENAKELDVDLSQLDCMVISHGHYDHSGGLIRALEEVPEEFPLYVGEGFFDMKCRTDKEKGYKYIGNGFKMDELSKCDIREVKSDAMHITDKIVLHRNFENISGFEPLNKRMVINCDGEYMLDPFRDEIVLTIKTSKGLVVIAGCSHVGIVNILKTVSKRDRMPIYAVIGGTHLMEANEDRIDKTVNEFKNMEIRMVAVSHCSGDLGIMKMHKAFSNEFIYNNTGQRIILST